MKRIKYFSIMTVMVIMLVSLRTAGHAVGLGFHLNTGGIYYGLPGMGEKGDMTLGAGILIDTSVAKSSIFNYRFKGDYVATLLEADLHRFKMDHAFGFGIVRSQTLRLWMGPKLGFGYAIGSYDGDREYTYNYWDIFIGAVVGLNFHVTRVMSIGIEAGYNYGTLFSMKKVSETTVNSATEHSKEVQYKIDENHPYHEGFVTFAFIFRIKDQYEAKKKNEVRMTEDVSEFVE